MCLAPQMVEAFSSLLAEHLGSLEESAVLLRPAGAAAAGAGAGAARAAPARRPPVVQQDRQLRRLHLSLLKQETEVRQQGVQTEDRGETTVCSNRRPR